jgi:hypothetical protein
VKDDKKKLMVLGALVAVMLGVGAFTFLGGSPTPPPADVTAKKDEETKEDGAKTVKVDEQGNPVVGEEADPPKNPLYAADLPQRDPFQENALPGEVLPPSAQQLPKVPTLPPVKRGGSRRTSGGGGAGYSPFPPPPLSGSLPGVGGGTVSVSPTGPDPSSFGYSLSGTMTGQRPIAVFTDSNGNQRLVPVGGSLDGDSKVVAVEKGSVTIEHRGKKQRLSLGGNPK